MSPDERFRSCTWNTHDATSVHRVIFDQLADIHFLADLKNNIPAMALQELWYATLLWLCFKKSGAKPRQVDKKLDLVRRYVVKNGFEVEHCENYQQEDARNIALVELRLPLVLYQQSNSYTYQLSIVFSEQ
jgi:hypothetical protein